MIDVQVNPKMEQRQCLNCANPFKTEVSSKRKFCTKVCQDDYAENKTDHLKEWKNDAPAIVKEVGLDKKIQSLKSVPMNEKEKLENQKNMNSMNIVETTIIKTDINSPNKYIEAEQDETHSTDLVEQSTNLETEICHSTNLLKSTANELHKLMIGLNGNQPPSDIRLYDVERVKAAAECGKQIISTMRMQLDILKFAKDIRNGQ